MDRHGDPSRGSLDWPSRMLPALLLALAAGLHPQDGPDADVRLTVEPDAVRLQVTVNLVFLDEYVEPFREDDESLHPVEHPLARDLGHELLREAVTLSIDGVEVTSRVAAFDVAPPDPDLVPHFPRFGSRAMTKLRWVLEYPAKSPPGEVDLSWTLFPPDEVRAVGPDIPTLEIVAHLKAEGSSRRLTLTEDGPRLRWESDPEAAASRFLAVPAVATGAGGVDALSPALWAAALLVLLVGRARPAAWAGASVLLLAGVLALRGSGAPPLEAQTARGIFEPLHQNLYRAFDYSRREDVYDALARSVHGDLLDELYDQVHASLVQAEEGGAVSEVQAVRRVELEPLDLAAEVAGRPGFTVETRWQVDGAVFHFGHSHWRTNEYRARFGVASTDEGWRLATHEMLEAVRVDSAPLTPSVEGEDL